MKQVSKKKKKAAIRRRQGKLAPLRTALRLAHGRTWPPHTSNVVLTHQEGCLGSPRLLLGSGAGKRVITTARPEGSSVQYHTQGLGSKSALKRGQAVLSSQPPGGCLCHQGLCPVNGGSPLGGGPGGPLDNRTQARAALLPSAGTPPTSGA